MGFTFEVIAQTYLPRVIHPAYSGIIQTQNNGEKRIPIFEILTAVKNIWFFRFIAKIEIKCKNDIKYDVDIKTCLAEERIQCFKSFLYFEMLTCVILS